MGRGRNDAHWNKNYCTGVKWTEQETEKQINWGKITQLIAKKVLNDKNQAYSKGLQ